MAAKTLTFMFAGVLGVSFSLLGIPTASAETWTFPDGVPPCVAACGTTHNFASTPGGVVIAGAGFSSPAALAGGTPDVQLFGKTLGGDETGLGLANDPTPGENEIQGTSLIRIAMAAGLSAPVTFQMDSTTAGEMWRVEGSNSATTGFVPLLTGTDELVSHTIPFFNFYTFDALAGNVLLAQITAVPGPIVGAGLPGLIAACGALLALARRRRQRIV
jgi:hypothetical protein